jgi:hypothetical protein
MQSNLQPIVAASQQLIRGRIAYTMQPVVAAAKDDERKAFARRLNEAIDRIAAAPQRGRPAWLVIQLRRTDPRLKLSQEAVRKWLSGESMPDQTHMAMLARLVDVDSDYLHTGRQTKTHERHGVRDGRPKYHGVIVSHEGAMLGAEWDKLPDDLRQALAMQIHCLVAAKVRGELSELKTKAAKAPRKTIRPDAVNEVQN